MSFDTRWFVFLAAATALLSATPADAVKRRAFATSVTGTGNLNTWPDADGAFALAAGDNICRPAAQRLDLSRLALDGLDRRLLPRAGTDRGKSRRMRRFASARGPLVPGERHLCLHRHAR